MNKMLIAAPSALTAWPAGLQHIKHARAATRDTR
jgi:hypothetical protein